MSFLLRLLRKIFGIKEKVSVEVEQPITPSSKVEVNNKYALLIGINKHITLQGADLNGCVNDVKNLYDRVTKIYGFPEDNVRVLVDERATYQNILERLEWLVSVAKPGDLLVLQYSGHGTHMRVRLDGKLSSEDCQLLVPTDMDWDNPLLDKTLAGYFRRIPHGAFLNFICDACFSGKMDRNLALGLSRVQTKIRFLPPPFDIDIRSFGRELPLNHIGWRGLEGPGMSNVSIFNNNRHLLFSGSRDNETAADAFIDGSWQGAMTSGLINTIDKKYDQDWFSAHSSILEWVISRRFSQIPQLSGPERVLKSPMFLSV